MLTAAIVVIILLTPQLLISRSHFSSTLVSEASCLAALSLTIGCVLVGWLSDRFGAPRVLIGVKRAFNQVAREMGLGSLVDVPDSEQPRRLEAREIDRNAYRQPIARERCPRESRSRRRPGWVVAHFVLPRPIIEGLSVLARGMAERERAERRNAPQGRRRRYPRTRNFYVTEALNALLADYDLHQFCVVVYSPLAVPLSLNEPLTAQRATPLAR